jgi:tetratricopeptide (TPR) repeat protein
MKLSAKAILSPLAAIGLSIVVCATSKAEAAQSAQSGQSSKPRIIHDTQAEELNALLAGAQKAIDAQDFATAAKDYQDFLTKQPNNANIHFQLGYAYTALKRPADAKDEYERAAELDPTMDAAFLNWGLSLLDTDPAAAIGPLSKAAELKPDEARPRLLLGWAYERGRKLPEAMAQFQAAEKLDDKDFDIHFALARSLLASNRAPEAETEFRAALALKDDSAPAHLGLAQSLIAQKKFDAGEPELAAYIAANPNDRGARLDHASMLVDLAKYPEALAELDKIGDLPGPDEIRVLKLRSESLFELKRYDDAIPNLARAAALAPQDPEIPARLGQLYIEKKDYADALKSLGRSFQIDPSSNDVLADIVAANYLSKNWPAALEAIDLLAKRKPLPIGSIFIRATCYDRLGQTKLALDGYQEFLRLNKDQTSDMYFEATARSRTLERELEKKR